MCLEKVCHSVIYCAASLRGRRLKGKGKGVLGARDARGGSRAQIPFPFPFERLPRRLLRCKADKGNFTSTFYSRVYGLNNTVKH